MRESQWFDNETFWKEMYPFMFSPQRFEAAKDEIDGVLELTKPMGTSVLDLCCGPGRCCIPLARKGFTVTGVDSSEYLLEKARIHSQQLNLDIEFICSDMRDFLREETFDLVINMFTSFGYFEDRHDDLLVLKNMASSMKPGAKLLIDVLGKERLAKILQHTTSSSLEDGSRLFQVHEICSDWSVIKNEWTLVKGEQAKSFTFHHRMYSGQELKDLMNQAGFVNVELYGAFIGAPYGPDALRLIAVGQKEQYA